MTNEEIYEYYKSIPRGQRARTITDHYNSLNVIQRREYAQFLSEYSKTDYKVFINMIRDQAIKDFWTNERELIKNGQSTRDWTPEQIESIMNFGVEGSEKKEGGRAFQIDADGLIVVDEMNNTSYYGHHMLSVDEYPEYAGDWRNIQALNYDEHYYGAHIDGNTQVSVKGYYDVETKMTIDFVEIDDKFSFEELGYPPKINSIFESDDVMSTIYENYDDFTDAEKLALKNVEYSISSKGSTEDFRRGLSIAEKYNSTDFEIKLGLDSQVVIQSKYKFFMSDVDDIVTYQIYEYYEDRNVSEEKMKQFGLDTDSMLKDKYQILKSCENPDTFDLFRSYEEYILDITDISSNSIICFDNDGNVIDIIIDDVDDGVQHIRPSGTTFETTIENARQHKAIYEVKSVYGIKTELTKLEQVMIQDLDVRTRSGSATVMSNADLISKHTFLAEGTDTDLNAYRAYEYLKSIGASDDTLRKTGILPDADLKSKYSFLSDCTDSAILDIFRANEYIKTNEIETSYAGKYASSLIHLDSDGNGISFYKCTLQCRMCL